MRPRHTPNEVLPWGEPALDMVQLVTDAGLVLLGASDAAKVAHYRWCGGARGQVVTHVGTRRTTIYLGRLLTSAEDDERVYHLNGVILDYRRSNLVKRRIKKKVRKQALTPSPVRG